MSSTWAFLADPDDFGWTELVEQGTAVWDGVKNAQAQRNLARCEPGDTVVIYHTAPDRAVVGLATVAGPARPEDGDTGRGVVGVRPVKPLARPLPLAEMKADAVLAAMSFVRMPRVAVQPVTPEQFSRILELSGTR
jgi:predicted RNA-binding protein with PUA-like domain